MVIVNRRRPLRVSYKLIEVSRLSVNVQPSSNFNNILWWAYYINEKQIRSNRSVRVCEMQIQCGTLRLFYKVIRRRPPALLDLVTNKRRKKLKDKDFFRDHSSCSIHYA